MEKAREIIKNTAVGSDTDYKKLENACKELAVFALETYSDDLRDLALNVAKAGMDFANWWRNEEEKNNL